MTTITLHLNSVGFDDIDFLEVPVCYFRQSRVVIWDDHISVRRSELSARTSRINIPIQNAKGGGQMKKINTIKEKVVSCLKNWRQMLWPHQKKIRIK